jgi:hypothetical protein
MEDKIYEHEIVTTVRFTFRSLVPYEDKAKLLEDFAWNTDFADFMRGDEYPRIVATTVVEDQVQSMNKEMEDA